jgi:nucleoporin NUP82
MPKVNSYAPAWLCRPSPGASFLTSKSSQSPAEDINKSSKPPTYGPSRTIARRGNEVFAVVDNEIRWSNLARLKDQWQQQTRQKKEFTEAGNVTDAKLPSFRVSIDCDSFS